MAHQDKKNRKDLECLVGVLPQVYSIELSIWPSIWAERFHVSRTHEFVHVMEGETVIHTGSKKVRAVSSDIFLLRKGSIHRDEFLREPAFRAFFTAFNWDCYDTLVPKNINAKLVMIPTVVKLKIREMVMEMYNIFLSDRPFARDMVNASMCNILLYCLSAVKTGYERGKRNNSAADKRHAIIDEAKQYIRNNFNRPISLSDIAEHLRLSEYYVSHIFGNETGFTVSSYVTQIRMKHAATLLRESANTVSEVAYRVGYTSPNYFGKVFYKYFNCTPSRYQLYA